MFYVFWRIFMVALDNNLQRYIKKFIACIINGSKHNKKFFEKTKMQQLCIPYPRLYHPYLYGMTVSIKTYTIIRTVRGDIMLLISSLDSLKLIPSWSYYRNAISYLVLYWRGFCAVTR